MDTILHAHSALTFAAWLLLQLLNAPQAVYITPKIEEEDDGTDTLLPMVELASEPGPDPNDIIRSALHNFRLCISFNIFDDDLGYWVKPRSTTWFSRFLLGEYDDNRWIHMFCMTKPAVFALADLLRPSVQRKDTRYRLAIFVLIRVACCLFKLTHGASLFICSKMFAIGKSTVSAILREVVHAINDTLKHELTWPSGDRLQQTQENFFNLCGLPAVVGSIDGTHIPISKPKHVPADYYYFKSGGYTLNCQAVVDSEKRFLDLYLGMPGSTNDSRMLRRSMLYNLAMHNSLMDDQHAVERFSPYLIGDLGYPLLPWLMVPHRSIGQLSIAERLFNKRLRRGRCVVENAFGILKQTFRELLTKLDLNVAFLPDVILACAILHNVLLGQSHEEVEIFLQVLQTKGLEGEVLDDETGFEGQDMIRDLPAPVVATEKRTDLGLFLTMERLHRQ